MLRPIYTSRYRQRTSNFVKGHQTLRTHYRLSGCLNERRPFEVGPQEDGVGSAVDVRPSAYTQVLGGADHVRESHKESSPLWFEKSRLSARYVSVVFLGQTGLTRTAKIEVQKKAPTKPSTVFLGLSLKSEVFPKDLPDVGKPGLLQLEIIDRDTDRYHTYHRCRQKYRCR